MRITDKRVESWNKRLLKATAEIMKVYGEVQLASGNPKAKHADSLRAFKSLLVTANDSVESAANSATSIRP